jgi:hypothetical protein
MTDNIALSRGDSPAYGDAVLEFLGDREPLEVFEASPAALRESVRGLSDAQLRRPEKPGKWSVIEVVQHLADAELVLGVRYRKVLAQPGEPIPSIEQDLWAEKLRYAEANVEDALAQFENTRRVNLAVLRRVAGEDWSLHGMHEQRGRETLEYMVRLYAAHDVYHLYQIDRIRKTIGA